MSNEDTERTTVEVARAQLSQLKEMEHYSRSNVEKLSAIWMVLSDELKQDDFAERVNVLLNKQGEFQQAIEELIGDYEIHCNSDEQK